MFVNEQTRDVNQPVVTVVNHISVMDDPSTWGKNLKHSYEKKMKAISLPFRNLWDISTARFSLAAQEILFTNSLYKFIFGYCGQAIPIVRGNE